MGTSEGTLRRILFRKPYGIKEGVRGEISEEISGKTMTAIPEGIPAKSAGVISEEISGDFLKNL